MNELERLSPFDRVPGVLKTKSGERLKALSPFLPDGRVKNSTQAKLDQVSRWTPDGVLKGSAR
jgi:hypothetical protein